MKKNKLFTALAAIALFTSASAVVESNNFSMTVSAAKKATTAKVKVKRGARLYRITFNKKGTKVLRITQLKSKGRAQALKGGTFNAIWSDKYKGVNYYYIGNSGNQAWAVRTRDAKVIGKKKIPTINAFVKANVAKANAKKAARQALQKEWQDKLDAAKPKSFTGKTNTEAMYFPVENEKPSSQPASDKLAMGTSLTIIYKMTGALKTNDGSIDAYIALDKDNNKTIIIPANEVSLDNGSASDVLTQDQYTAANKNYEDIYAQAKKALGIK